MKTWFGSYYSSSPNHLKDAAPASAMPEFLGSHPDINKRIAYIREVSKNWQIEENSWLKTIFDKLN